MKEKKGDDNFFMDFLKKDSHGLENVLKEQGAGEKSGSEQVTEPSTPVLLMDEQAEASELSDFWRNLRSFFRTGKGGGLPTMPSEKLLPANMIQYRHAHFFESEYPVWMEGELGVDNDLSLPSFDSVSHLMDQSCETISDCDEEVQIFRANHYRLEKIQREYLAGKEESTSLRQLLEHSFPRLLAELKLSDQQSEKFEKFLSLLLDQLSWEGKVLGFSKEVTSEILVAALQSHRNRSMVVMQAEVKYLIARLLELLEIESLNKPDANNAGQLKGSMDFVESFIDFEDLASVMAKTGSQRMPEDRLQRIQNILTILERMDDLLWKKEAVLILEEERREEETARWSRLLPDADLVFARPGNMCNTAIEKFEVLMSALARMFGAIRIAQLELEDKYYPATHEEFFANFDWHLFSSEEIAVCPPVILVSSEENLLHEELNHFSYMLSTSRPIHTLALKSDARSGYTGLKDGDQVIVPQELGSFAVSHRNTYVLQSTPISPDKLYAGFSEGLNRHVPCIYHVLVHEKAEGDVFDEYLWTSAAVESREFPGFLYDNYPGSRWGSRFTISANPAAEEDWPQHQVTYEDGEGEEKEMTTAFTFADFAAQDPDFSEFFMPVPSSCWTDDMVAVSDYLRMAHDETYGKVPFIWMVDHNWKLTRVAVTWSIVLACRERLDYWDYLQENAGIHNVHVEAAVDKLKSEMEEEFEKERAGLAMEYQSKMERAVEEAAGMAMKKLASVLLDMGDMPDIPTTSSRKAAVPVTVSSAEAPAADEVEEAASPPREEEEISLGGEVWIETPLCTSCNECTNLNDSIFQYNGSKQAFVADPKGGPFRDIVEAAEMCPASIIHPGSPQDPDEEGLEELIKRAEPFN